MPKTKEKFVIIDGNAVIHRAFHALPPLATKDGTVVNALYGFLNIIFRVIKEVKPKYFVVTFDVPGKTFRHKMFKEYKATRKKQPDELYAQIKMAHEAVEAFGLSIYEKSGYEADDVIGTITKQIPEHIDCYIVTGDMDVLQLVDDHTFVYAMRKGVSDTVVYDKAAVKEKYQGLIVEQMIDYKALRGDPSDNIPGVKGIGEKGAISLLTEYKNIENVLKNVEKITGATHKKLKAGKEAALLSKELATIKRDVPIKFKLADTTIEKVDQSAVIKLVQKYEFKSLLKQAASLSQDTGKQQGLFDQPTETESYLEKSNYVLVNTEAKAKKLVKEVKQQSTIAFDTETTSLDTLQCELVGFSFSWKEKQGYYVLAKFTKLFKPIFEDKAIKKIAHNAKFDYKVLMSTHGIKVENLFYDTMLASYVLNPGTRGHGLDALALTECGHQMMSYENLVGKGKKAISITEVPIDKLAYYAAEDADITWRLYKKLKPRIKEKNAEKILQMELDLIPILADMELNGISIDTAYLKKMGQTLGKDIKKIETKIFKLAGMEFNIASPKQLKEVLFEKLDIDTTGIAKKKTGYSTAASELEKLRDRHPIIDLISEFRELSKLKSTYVDALPELVNFKTKRIHTHFNQTITATGRLSSTDPNLQNIPIRTELGRKIRKAFVAPKNKVLLSLDYSQVELRIVAHVANDEDFIKGFKDKADIHTRTAAQINEVEESEVTKEMRYDAKSVNFGILYGMGVFGLMRDSNMSRYEAQDYLDRYFLNHPAIKDYIEKIKTSTKRTGYAETMFGRKRYLPDINSGMPMVRAAAERAAINMPIQGTAADLMKLAMLEVAQAIVDKRIKATLLLQVHDELVFEVDKTKVKSEAKKIKQIMENVYELKVPLVVDIGVGTNWQDIEDL